MSPGSQQRQTFGGVWRVSVIALMLTAGTVATWTVLPPAILAGGGQRGLWQAAVATLVVFPLALCAVGAVGWFAGWRHRRAGAAWPRLARASAIAGLFALLLLITTPAQSAVYAGRQDAPGQPNLAAVRYDVSCLANATPDDCEATKEAFAGVTAESVRLDHHAMMAKTWGASAAHRAIDLPFLPGDQAVDPDATAYAIQDAFLVLVVTLPVALLGIYLAGRFRSASRRGAVTRADVRRHRFAVSRVRSRWIAASLAGALVVTGNVFIATAATAADPFSAPLYIPPVLTSPNPTVTMRETDVQILPDGPPTRMWTYNGTFPGPTIRRPSGTTTRVTFRNQLPVTAGEQTIHHHGAHSRSSEDGQPDSFLIPVGRQRTYTYDHWEAGEPERAVTQWYHDHRMDVTGRNVWNGLAGMFILDDAVDSALPLPKGEFDVPLVITDRTFDANNQIPYTFNILGTLGDTWLVNGRPQPFFSVGDRKYRIRILNAANRRPLVLALSNGQPMTQIAADSGLLPAPVQRTSIILQPAERVEIVVDFAGLLGQQVVLMDTNTPATPGNPPKELMQFRVDRDLDDTSLVPTTLRPAPTFPEPTKDREFVLRLTTNADGTPTMWTINNQGFDPNRVDADPVLNTTERWTFMNVSPQPHAIHLHDVDWQLVRRFNVATDANGNPTVGSPLPVQPFEAALKETYFVPANTGFSVVTTFTDRLGPYMIHCHMLEHEDMAMMARFVVKPPPRA